MRKALDKLEPGLPAGWYHDPAHYQRELEAFWYRGWIAVARAEEIAAPGDWRLVRVGTQSLFVTRGDEGEQEMLVVVGALGVIPKLKLFELPEWLGSPAYVALRR